MSTVLCEYRNGRLVPASGRAKQELRLARLKDGDLVSVKIIKSRNPKLCGLSQMIFAKIGDAVGVSAAAIEAQVKLALGYCDLIERADGKIELSPKRMDFDTVPSEDDFREFWQRAEALICERILPDMDDEARGEIFEILDGRE